MRRIIFDIETTGEMTGGGIDIAKQELTVCCIHDSETDTFSSYFKEDLPKLWPLLERTDIIVGYNSDHFDIPILNKYYSGDLSKIKSIDLLKEIKNVLGRRLRLDNIAGATLGRGKTANGMQAVKWWKEGKKDLVRDYCIEDVRVTKDLYEYAKKNGVLKYTDFDGPAGKPGAVRDIKLDSSSWENVEDSPALTHTLPW